MARPYTGTKDAVHARKREGTVAVYEWLRFLFGLRPLGVFSNRDVRGRDGKKSVHATFRAMDLGGTHEQLKKAIDFVYLNRDRLGIEAIHDYAGNYVPNPKGHGAAYYCDRDNGGLLAGWKVYSRPTLGSPNATWMHVEVSPATADKTRAQMDAIFSELVA